MKHLKYVGYFPSPQAQHICVHKTRPTKFCPFVNNFGLKYFSEIDAYHLIESLRTAYTIIIDRTGSNFCGL